MRGEGARGGLVRGRQGLSRKTGGATLRRTHSGADEPLATLASGMKTFLIMFAASTASAIGVLLFTRAASAHARFDGEWWHLDVGRRHYALLSVCWLIPLFLSGASLFDLPQTTGQYVILTVLIGSFWVFAAYATYQVFLVEYKWNGHEIRRFSWLFGWRFLLLRDLVELKEIEDGSARLTSKRGEHLKFDRTWNGAPAQTETCRRHIAANTATSPVSSGRGP